MFDERVVGIPANAKMEGRPTDASNAADSDTYRERVAALEERVEMLRRDLQRVCGERDALAAVLRIHAERGRLSCEQARRALAKLGV